MRRVRVHNSIFPTANTGKVVDRRKGKTTQDGLHLRRRAPLLAIGDEFAGLGRNVNIFCDKAV